MKSRLNFLLLATILTTSLLVGCASTAPTEVLLKTVLQDFKDNEYNATETYENKYLQIKAVVMDVDRDMHVQISDNRYIELNKIKCNVRNTSNNRDFTKSLKKGDIIEFKGMLAVPDIFYDLCFTDVDIINVVHKTDDNYLETLNEIYLKPEEEIKHEDTFTEEVE